MKRMQLYINEELERGVALAARKRGCSRAAIIRECVRDQLSEQNVEVKGAESGHDPLDELVGAYAGKVGSVDEVIYGNSG